MPRANDIAKPGSLTAQLLRQPTVVTHLVKHRQHPRRRIAAGNRVLEELPNRDQHRVDPSRLPHHYIGSSNALPGRPWTGCVAKPQHEHPEAIGSITPVAMNLPAPQQVQRNRRRIRPGRALRATPAEPQMLQKPIGSPMHMKFTVDHRPIPRTRGQPNPKRSHERPT